jgi:PAS domain S-box-containing protein
VQSVPEGAFIVSLDITERKHAGEALLTSMEEFRTLAEAMPQIVWTTRADGWNIYFNQHWMDYTGLTLEESRGHGWNKPFHPDDQQRAWDELLDRAMTDAVVITLGEGRCLGSRDGRMMPVDYTLAPIRDDHGWTIGCVIIFRENTTHLDVEKASTQKQTKSI